MTTPVYIVGFPKSGNTWLTRLLADALGAPVAERPMRGFLELASQINATLPGDGASGLRVAKIHFLPEIFVREIDPSPRRVVYVHRDVRDVCVSGFCHFLNGCEADLLPASEGTRLARWLHERRRGRQLQRLRTFVDHLTSRGIPGVEDQFGTWQGHIAAWRAFAEASPETRFVTVAYESLRADTVGQLQRIIAGLDLPMPDRARIEAAAQRQSLGRLRETYRQWNDPAADQIGRDLLQRFFRRGSVGDGQRLLDRACLDMIDQRCGDAMRSLGYASTTLRTLPAAA